MKRISRFRVILIVLLTLIILFLVIPVFTITELVYPVRLDSAYLRSKQIAYEATHHHTDSGEERFLYNPSQLGLIYQELKIKVPETELITLWTVNDSDFLKGNHLLVIPDIFESKLNYIKFSSEATARGLTIDIAELRGQGTSSGSVYTPGSRSADDIIIVIDSLQARYGFDQIALMGSGTGAAVALKTGLKDERVAAIILENPFLNLRQYFKKYAEKKYGLAGKLFYRRMLKSYFKESGLDPDSVKVSKMVADCHKPIMFITRVSTRFLDYQSSQKLFFACPSQKKTWLAIRDFDEADNRQATIKKYFDRLATFVNVNLAVPGKLKPRSGKVA
ncbi:MAG: alpha/beta hydrolase [Bacteroidia bacterium]|nr:alpha/beta hydrolase [Bacteroidia bacterium]MCZ2276554.1 alpha/beta hydrolase [Bacteroidia bacterium]